MHKLYTEYAQIYHTMYPGLIDYAEEFDFYHQLLKQYQCTSVLEIACGTGQLGRALLAAGYAYQGLDLSAEMLSFARTTLPQARFHQQDMRNIQLEDTFDAVIITARSISYLLTNSDVFRTFACIHQHLNPGGLLAFDCIDASSYIPHIMANPVATHEVETPAGTYRRESRYTLLLDQGWLWNWQSKYFFHEPQTAYRAIGEDECTIRGFTSDEMTLLLQLSGFEVDQIINRPSYAFDTKVPIACKAG